MLIIPKIPYINKLTEERYKRIIEGISKLNSDKCHTISEEHTEEMKAMIEKFKREKGL